jgi:drug/metabolite transporter (DMT)-like permease
LVLSLLWGGSFYFIGIAVTELPTFTIVFLRVGIAALGLHVILASWASGCQPGSEYGAHSLPWGFSTTSCRFR